MLQSISTGSLSIFLKSCLASGVAERKKVEDRVSIRNYQVSLAINRVYSIYARKEAQRKTYFWIAFQGKETFVSSAEKKDEWRKIDQRQRERDGGGQKERKKEGVEAKLKKWSLKKNRIRRR